MHFLQQVGGTRKIGHYMVLSVFIQGRLVNIQNYSLSTIASVIKKFLRKVGYNLGFEGSNIFSTRFLGESLARKMRQYCLTRLTSRTLRRG